MPSIINICNLLKGIHSATKTLFQLHRQIPLSVSSPRHGSPFGKATYLHKERSLNLIQLASPWIAIFSTTFVISSRHLLYSAVYRQQALRLPRLKRYALAFLLTDEMFALSENFRKESGSFNYRFAIVSGLVFYVVWNLASLAGIVLGEVLGDTDALGFEFAVAAIFIAMVMPGVTNVPVLGAVLVSALVAVIAELNGLSYGILLAGLSGMTAGFALEKWRGPSQ